MKYLKKFAHTFESVNLKDDVKTIRYILSDLTDEGFTVKVLYVESEFSNNRDVIAVDIISEYPEKNWNNGGNYLNIDLINSKIEQLITLDRYEIKEIKIKNLRRSEDRYSRTKVSFPIDNSKYSYVESVHFYLGLKS
jgi:hypothetical protein